MRRFTCIGLVLLASLLSAADWQPKPDQWQERHFPEVPGKGARDKAVTFSRLTDPTMGQVLVVGHRCLYTPIRRS